MKDKALNTNMPEGPNGPAQEPEQHKNSQSFQSFVQSKETLAQQISKTVAIVNVDDMAMIVYVELKIKETKRSPCLDTLGLFSRIKAPRMSPSQDTKQNKSCCSSSLSSQI